MITRHFEYVAPESAAHAVAALAADPDGARILGGGTWLVPDMNRGAERPRRVVDLRCAGLRGIERRDGVVHVGAMTTYADVLASAVARSDLPLLWRMAAGVTGGRQIAAQGTLGGSAIAARPQSDVPAAIVALDATALILAPGGERRVPAAALFADAMQTSLSAGEVLTGFELPSARGRAHGYVKLKHGASSWPIATAAALVDFDEDRRCTHASVVVGGVGRVPARVDLTEPLAGETGPEVIAAAAQAAARAVGEPWSDVLAGAEYRMAVAAPVARRALEMAFTIAEEQ